MNRHLTTYVKLRFPSCNSGLGGLLASFAVGLAQLSDIAAAKLRHAVRTC